MKYLLTILSLLILNTAISQPVANAGADQTIYLTSTNQATLNGTGSTGTGLNYQWREVSTDYSSGATISSPTSVTTNVVGLPQGVFYFELAVTDNVDRVSADTVKIDVDYAGAPANSTLLRTIAPVFSDMVPVVNDRTDTTDFIAGEESIVPFNDANPGEIFYDRARSNQMFIDAQRGKFYSILEDGYQWNNDGYDRVEMHFGSDYTLDTSKIYTFEWKGYFPQLVVTDAELVLIWQLHGNDGNSPPFALRPSGGNLILDDLDYGGDTKTVICSLADLVNQTHTIRITIKEGMNGFFKLLYDGVTKYSRTTGQVGRFSDYPKFGTLYDWANSIVDVNNHTRNKKFPLVTENFNVYTVTDTTTVAAPTISMAGNQSITTTSTSTSGVVTWASGHSGTVQWSVTSAPNTPTFSAQTSESTGVSNLITGTYVLRLTATQDDGQTAYGEVTITVNISSGGGIYPFFVTHKNKVWQNN